ncbi:aminotransferase class I/II-fold pyridoxal phosphate-dependent enzyme [Candidatus Bathyarchaeota archaeon]|nr:aminotransferase class I/II-fold pyridoxal phosphate-dependent enzyme [Candidatus Bathyarchaeota archaeon]
MRIKDFKLERFFAEHEFSVKYVLGASDCEGIMQRDLFSMADKDSLALWNNLKLGYTESQGHPVLREEISELYQGIEAKDVMVLAPQEGIFVVINSLLDKKDHVIVTFPAYQSLYEVAETIGCEVTKWMPDPFNNWELDVDFLRRNIKSNTKLLVINFPHNPTGYLPTKEKFLEIIEIAKEHVLYVFSDEMYRFLEYEKTDRLPSACEIYDKSVVLFGMSKTFSLPGLRIGWLITKEKELFKKFSSFKDYTTICSSAPSEILSIMALRTKNRIIDINLKIIKNNLNLFESFVSKNNELLSFIKPRAGSIAFPSLNKKVDSSNFCLNLIKEKSVMLLPSEVYDYKGNNFRIGFGRTNFSEAINKLEEFINEKQF